MSNIIAFLILSILSPVTLLIMFLNEHKEEIWEDWRKRMIKKGRK